MLPGVRRVTGVRYPARPVMRDNASIAPYKLFAALDVIAKVFP